MTELYDVIVVGAGLSGLQAAIDVQSAGLSCLVLEARDRIGGKIFTTPRPDSHGSQDLGAVWFNDTNQSKIWSYVTKFGLKAIVQPSEGYVGFQDADGTCSSFQYGGMPPFGEEDKRGCVRIRDIINDAGLSEQTFTSQRRTELSNMSLLDYLMSHGASKRALQSASVWCHGMLGAELGEVSAFAFLEVCRGGLGITNMRSDRQDGPQYLRLEEGTTALVKGMAGLLREGSICLSTSIVSIEQSAAIHTIVNASDGRRFEARKVILSIPGPTLKTINFTPSLPRDLAAYATTVRYGTYVKYIVLFSNPIWREKEFCGLAQSFKGPASIFRDTSCDSKDNYALTAFIASRPGRQWLQLDDDARKNAVLEQISIIFQQPIDYVRDSCMGTLTTEWTSDQWAGYGCPFATCPPGGPTGWDGLPPPYDNVHFIGTEFSKVWKGFMEGALRSGEEGAKAVVAELKGR